MPPSPGRGSRWYGSEGDSGALWFVPLHLAYTFPIHPNRHEHLRRLHTAEGRAARDCLLRTIGVTICMLIGRLFEERVVPRHYTDKELYERGLLVPHCGNCKHHDGFLRCAAFP